jgi:hypothetical protein
MSSRVARISMFRFTNCMVLFTFKTHVPDAGGRERQLVRHRSERGQSIGDGVDHQAADRDDRALASALDAERVAMRGHRRHDGFRGSLSAFEGRGGQNAAHDHA